jgi:hypothetical protein
MSASGAGRRSVDVRTRGRGDAELVDPAAFWGKEWAAAVQRNGDQAAADAELLGLDPLTVHVDGESRTLRLGAGGIEALAGEQASTVVTLDHAAFSDLVHEERTALGLVIGGRVEGEGPAHELFCAWDPVLRSVLDGRGLHRPGAVSLQASDGSDLDLGQRFRLDERDAAAQFLAEAGFLLLQGVFTEVEIAALDAEMAEAVETARPDDGASWWAATRDGERYPCRILDLADRSEQLRSLLDDPRFLAIGRILDDGHEPGDPFGEHFSAVTAEGLVKRVGSVEGLACLPWHKDCERGGHSMFCCGLTIGICLTPVDPAHGGLDVIAGSHRAHIARRQVERGLDLPVAALQAERGDVTVHLSCALHQSTHPQSIERRVIYTGFALPPRPGDHAGLAEHGRLLSERAAIAGRHEAAPFSVGRAAGSGPP